MQEGYVSTELLFLWMLLMATVVATFLIQRFHLTAVPPSAAAMVLGMVAGLTVKLTGMSAALEFSPSAFFYGLLPPIVFAAGFTIKKRAFFRNIGTISMFAVLGTFISTLVFGLLTYLLMLLHIVKRSHLGSAPLVECLLYGALISATDPVATLSVFAEADVPPLLFNLVFGESVLNDAVAIVLFRTLEDYHATPLTLHIVPRMIGRFLVIGIGSLICGVGVALASAFVLKRLQRVENPGGSAHEEGSVLAFNATVYEVSLIVMAAYAAYLVAEVLGLSGIVALFFSGICHAHYSYYCVNLEAQVTLRRFFEFAAFLSETFVFAYLGLQVAVLHQKGIDWGMILTGLPLLILSRAANIFPVAYLVNLGRKLLLPGNLQVMMAAVGLRGAVAYGLALNLPMIVREQETSAQQATGIPSIEVATLVLVVVSTLLFGGLTGPLLKKLELVGATDAQLHATAYVHRHADVSHDEAIQRMQEAGTGERGSLHGQWKAFDKGFMKPLFGGRGQHTSGPSMFSSPSRDEEALSLLDAERQGMGHAAGMPYEDLPGTPNGVHIALQPSGADEVADAEVLRPGHPRVDKPP